ncbi:alpha/beta hydrolase [Amycolatopsis sp. SID8362]|uniref:alpha/beta hydrolase family protein n=1 Tax=Amycolatopsis sp. SID8362 TaxID=2690346 RepID=UPI00137045B0|nr:alpha/beta hydrolase [Amycolatopsis sp. SID8362]NBH03066.1 alpha/beta fold hydrolase [Amycolatopsis sp. SID8362]NED39767.1 alpha/beta hydrolase [Amycolatopsis sp. SID8362]
MTVTEELVREVTFPSAAGVLAGSLAVPDRSAPVPGVVMVGGSGPSDRTNDNFFPLIRGHLVAAGLAVLSYDKRGVGASSGDWLAGTIDDFAVDAVSALNFLRAEPGVQAEATGLFGHSEGGWVVLRAAAREDVPWVVTNGCPGMTPAVQDRYALATALAAIPGVTPSDAEMTLAAYDRLVEAGRHGADFAEASRFVRAFSIPAAVRELFGEYWSEMNESSWEFTKRKQDHDPIPDVLRLRCPHLATFGGADELVPVADSVALFTAAACRAERHPRATLTVEVFPHADHRVRVPGEPALVTGFVETLARWITEMNARSSA